LEKINAFSLLNLVEINNALNFAFKNREIYLIISKLLSCSESVIVFGSYASSLNKKDSDLDVVLLGKVNSGEIRKIKSISPVEINEHSVTYFEFKKILKSKNPLSVEICKNHILFGNFSEIVKIFLEDRING